MAVDTAAKRYAMLGVANGPIPAIWYEVDGSVDADDRAVLLGLYGGNAFDSPTADWMPRAMFLHWASGGWFPLGFQPDGSVDFDDRAFLLKHYGGIAWDSAAPGVSPRRGPFLKNVNRVGQLG